MKKKYIVKNSRDFEKIIKEGKCKKNQSFIIHSKQNELDYDKYGISVSKKLGNAVFRNKYKRIIRSILDNYKKLYINNKDYIIILRKEVLNLSFIEFKEQKTRVCISVSKKLGNAVFRNKYKRKIRAIIDNYKKMYINHEDYIIILRRGAVDKSFQDLEKDFLALMKH